MTKSKARGATNNTAKGTTQSGAKEPAKDPIAISAPVGLNSNLDPTQSPDDVEQSLRPSRLAEFIGQPKVKETLAIAIKAALGRSETLDHRQIQESQLP